MAEAENTKLGIILIAIMIAVIAFILSCAKEKTRSTPPPTLSTIDDTELGVRCYYFEGSLNLSCIALRAF